MDYELVVLMMRFHELRAELVEAYETFKELCGADDEINTLEAKRLLDNLDEIKNFIKEFKEAKN